MELKKILSKNYPILNFITIASASVIFVFFIGVIEWILHVDTLHENIFLSIPGVLVMIVGVLFVSYPWLGILAILGIILSTTIRIIQIIQLKRSMQKMIISLSLPTFTILAIIFCPMIVNPKIEINNNVQAIRITKNFMPTFNLAERMMRFFTIYTESDGGYRQMGWSNDGSTFFFEEASPRLKNVYSYSLKNKVLSPVSNSDTAIFQTPEELYYPREQLSEEMKAVTDASDISFTNRNNLQIVYAVPSPSGEWTAIVMAYRSIFNLQEIFLIPTPKD